MSLKIRRGTNAERLTITPVEGELIYTTDTKNLYIGDGTTAGGKFVTGVGYTGSASTSRGYTGSATRIPTGGTTGQVLSKVSNTDYDVDWSTISGGFGGNGYTGSQGEVGYIGSVGYTGSFSGTLQRNLSLSTYSIIGSNLEIKGSNGSLKLGDMTLSDSFIDSATGLITLGNNSTGMQVDIKSNGGQGFNFTGATTGSLTNNNSITPSLKVYTSKGSINSPSKIDPGQVIFSQVYAANDGTSNQGRSSMAFFMIDNQETVTTNQTPGKIVFLTFKNNSTSNALSFDASGRLGINTINATETLDVAGTGKFSGYVVFGSYTTTARNALTPQNGMVIYNTTDGKFQGRQAGVWINLDTGTAA